MVKWFKAWMAALAAKAEADGKFGEYLAANAGVMA